ncbi:unnamed protein product, partial [marine sediment metagenome]
MSGKYPYGTMTKYPHLDGQERILWHRFIQKYPSRFDTYDYDVKIRVVPEILPLWDKKTFDYWALITKKTIDVIGWKKNSATIIEVKLRLGLATLGQVLGYRFLFHHEYP